jgi:uncharacterized protein (DUF1015 family)
MAKIFPFQPYRYTVKAGDLSTVVTQPYDKIDPEMQKRYLSLSPHNLVRVILGERGESDSEHDNVYTRAAAHVKEWIDSGILAKDDHPALFAYFQHFTVPDTGERLTRKGFIGLGAVEEYSEGTVHRHEQTLSSPKKDRRDLLEATRCHFGQIFMLYDDPTSRIDAELDAASRQAPVADVTDEYGTHHVLYPVAEESRIQQIQSAMSGSKLLIADGHHRYETALAFRNDHPELEDAKRVMMTFVDLHSPGLRILATHRVISGLNEFDPQTFLKRSATRFRLARFDHLNSMIQVWEQPALEKIRIGVALAGVGGVYMLERERQSGEIDVEVLHTELIEGALGISADAVREQRNIRYVRGIDAAVDTVLNGESQIALLLEATTVKQVADWAFNGRCMPQKSTDFYPKLLSGLTMYRIER